MRKLLQNTFFAALLAWALQGIHQVQLSEDASDASQPLVYSVAFAQR